MTAREGWNVHGWWIGDAANEVKAQAPPRARCGGPNVCRCPRVPTRFPTACEFPTTTCKFCKEPIVWAETQPNRNARTPEKRAEVKLVPMDAEPVDFGVIILTANPNGGRPLYGEMPTRNAAAGWRAAGKKTYQKHVKTCTQVIKWPKGPMITKARERKA